MKKLVMLSSLFIGAMLMFSSCEKIKDLTDVDFDADLKADVQTMSEGEEAATVLKGTQEKVYHFEGHATVDPTSESEVKKYWKKIRAWEVKRITVVVKNISKEAVLQEGQLVVKDESTNEILFSETVSDLQLRSGAAVFSISGADWGEVISALTDKHSLVVGVEGDLDQPSVSVTYGVVISVKITANIFN